LIAHCDSDGRPHKLGLCSDGRPSRRLRGRVHRFDERRGVGEIVSEDGKTFAFHSTAIEGGGRRIAVETPVEFDVEAGLPGRWEAARIENAS
jgi:cold shock CspA family protein